MRILLIVCSIWPRVCCQKFLSPSANLWFTFSSAVARDIGAQVREILTREVMTMPYQNFAIKTENINKLFQNFSSKFQQLTRSIRERRILSQGSSNPMDILGGYRGLGGYQDTELQFLKERVEQVVNIRTSHHQLLTVVRSTFENEKVHVQTRIASLVF